MLAWPTQAFEIFHYNATVSKMETSAKNILSLISAIVILLLGLFTLGSEQSSSIATDEAAQVSDESNLPVVQTVIDGDTLRLENGERVRLIGINAPERGQPYYEEATAALTELTLGQRVRLERDVSERDQYDRRLAYVYVGGVMANEELVARGLAKAYPFAPDTSKEDIFRRAELAAQATDQGMWSTSKGGEGAGLIISDFNYNAAGDDNENLEDEYFTLFNPTDTVIHLTGFRISDTANHEYQFPSFVLGAGKSVTVRTGTGDDTATDLYWNNVGTVWNNDGDTLYLYDHKGYLVLWYQ